MSCFSGGRGFSSDGKNDAGAGEFTEFTVELLDDMIYKVKLKNKSKAQLLMNNVCNQLNLQERDYFGLRLLDNSKTSHWLDLQKGLLKQIKRHGINLNPLKFYFGVKFYATDPCKLREEVTRYQFFLQLKRDVLSGRIPVAFDNLVELCSLAVQSELGDYDPSTHTSGYVSELRLAPQQSEDLEQSIASSHQKLVGFYPSACEYMYLDKIKWQEMYGVDLHLVKGVDNTEFCIGLTPSGLVIYRQKNKVGIYYWPRISGINFKSKKFSLKVQDRNGLETSYYFTFETKESCKSFWKCCIEHHTFFRRSQAEAENGISDFFQLGSKFRYSGRTEKEIAASEPARSPQPVRRTKSQRQERRHSKPENSTSLESMLSPIGTSASYAKPHTPKVALSNGGSLHAQSYNMVTSTANFSSYQQHTPTSNPHNSSHVSSDQPNISTVSEGSVRRETALDISWISQGGLFTSGRDSPKSVRSDKMKFPVKLKNDSGSEADSSYTKRSRRTPESPEDGKHAPYHHGYSRRESDNESERSGLSRRRRRRYQRGYDSGSDAESIHRRMRRSSERMRGGQRNNESFRESSTCSGMSTPRSEMCSKSSRRYRDNLTKRNISEELIKHIHTKLVDSTDLTTKQRQDIPYTSVNMLSPDSGIRKVSGLPSSTKPARYDNKDSVDTLIEGIMVPPPPLRRTSSSSYENLLYDKSGSVQFIGESEPCTKYESNHLADYATISPPQKFDSGTLKLSSDSSYGTLTSSDRKRENIKPYGSLRNYTSNSSTLTTSSNSKRLGSSISNETPQLSNSNEQSPGNGGHWTEMKHSTPQILTTASSRYQTSANSYNIRATPIHPSTNIASTSVSKQFNGHAVGVKLNSNGERWVEPMDIYKHTYHETSPKVIGTSSDHKHYSPAMHLYSQNNCISQPTNGNLVSYHATPRKQLTSNCVHDTLSNESFYTQYSRRKGFIDSDNGFRIANTPSKLKCLYGVSEEITRGRMPSGR